MSRKKTDEEFKKEIEEIYGNRLTILSNYKGSHEKILTQCNICTSIWEPTPTHLLTRDKGCPYCAGKKVLVGFNDLKTKRPDLAAEWDYEKNEGLIPEDVTIGTHKRAWWICSKCNNSYDAKISNRNTGYGCPYCENLKIKEGFNDLATLNPNLASEWNYKKNDVLPTEVAPSAKRKVWWECKYGHEWEASINSRSRGVGCPTCASEKTASYLQIKVQTYVETKYKYKILHENDCTLVCISPKTKKKLKYDNEVIVENQHLIIEVMGLQHYYAKNSFHQKLAETTNKSLEEVFSELQWRDEYKKQYALKNGYHYIAIPFNMEQNEKYKYIIDKAIKLIIGKGTDEEWQLLEKEAQYQVA